MVWDLTFYNIQKKTSEENFVHSNFIYVDLKSQFYWWEYSSTFQIQPFSPNLKQQIYTTKMNKILINI